MDTESPGQGPSGGLNGSKPSGLAIKGEGGLRAYVTPPHPLKVATGESGVCCVQLNGVTLKYRVGGDCLPSVKRRIRLSFGACCVSMWIFFPFCIKVQLPLLGPYLLFKPKALSMTALLRIFQARKMIAIEIFNTHFGKP